MKTYWLLGKDSAAPTCPFAGDLMDEEEETGNNKIAGFGDDDNDTNENKIDVLNTADDRRSLYSPVTFEEVRKSHTNLSRIGSPVKTTPKVSPPAPVPTPKVCPVSKGNTPNNAQPLNNVSQAHVKGTTSIAMEKNHLEQNGGSKDINSLRSPQHKEKAKTGDKSIVLDKSERLKYMPVVTVPPLTEGKPSENNTQKETPQIKNNLTQGPDKKNQQQPGVTKPVNKSGTCTIL